MIPGPDGDHLVVVAPFHARHPHTFEHHDPGLDGGLAQPVVETVRRTAEPVPAVIAGGPRRDARGESGGRARGS